MNRPQHDSLKKKAFKLPGVAQAYADLEEEFAIIAELIKARKIAGESQKEVARLMNTSTSAISRLESGASRRQHSPSLLTLRRYAHALGCRLSIKLIPDPKLLQEKTG